MSKFFKPEDFMICAVLLKEHARAAEIANRLLQERGVRVVGHKSEAGWVMEQEEYLDDTKPEYYYGPRK